MCFKWINSSNQNYITSLFVYEIKIFVDFISVSHFWSPKTSLKYKSTAFLFSVNKVNTYSEQKPVVPTKFVWHFSPILTSNTSVQPKSMKTFLLYVSLYIKFPGLMSRWTIWSICILNRFYLMSLTWLLFLNSEQISVAKAMESW